MTRPGFCNAHNVKLQPTVYPGGTWNVCPICEANCKAVGNAFKKVAA